MGSAGGVIYREADVGEAEQIAGDPLDPYQEVSLWNTERAEDVERVLLFEKVSEWNGT